MADRKQFQKLPASDPELKRLLDEARKKEITQDELREQRISFAFGNAPADAKEITKDSIQIASTKLTLLS